MLFFFLIFCSYAWLWVFRYASRLNWHDVKKWLKPKTFLTPIFTTKLNIVEVFMKTLWYIIYRKDKPQFIKPSRNRRIILSDVGVFIYEWYKQNWRNRQYTCKILNFTLPTSQIVYLISHDTCARRKGEWHGCHSTNNVREVVMPSKLFLYGLTDK